MWRRISGFGRPAAPQKMTQGKPGNLYFLAYPAADLEPLHVVIPAFLCSDISFYSPVFFS
jgi:hypothetical protein